MQKSGEEGPAHRVCPEARLLPEPLTCGEDGLDQLAPQGPIQCLDLGCVVSGWAQLCQAVGGGVWTHNDFLRAEEDRIAFGHLNPQGTEDAFIHAPIHSCIH